VDFAETEAQSELAGLAKKIFTERISASRLAQTEATPDRFDADLWADLAGAGVLAAALPEGLGGAGLGLLEQCSVLIEAGRSLAPVPYLFSAVLGAGAIARFGTPEQQEKWAAPAGRGELIITVALEEDAVPFAPLSKLILVPAGGTVYLVEPDADGITVERQEVTGGGSAGRVTVDPSRLDAQETLGDGAAEWLLATATVGLCAQQAGVTARALELTAGYTRTREQFGKPIGAFQAVAQRLADAYVDVEAIRLTMWQAAWRLSEGLDAAAEIACAKFWAADGGHRVAHTAVHLHGGVGIDTEAETHRYFTAAKQCEFALGGATAQLLRIGASL